MFEIDLTSNTDTAVTVLPVYVLVSDLAVVVCKWSLISGPMNAMNGETIIWSFIVANSCRQVQPGSCDVQNEAVKL